MPDYSSVDPQQEMELFTEVKMKDLHVCLPGIIQSFDPTAQTVTVQPAVKMKTVREEGGESSVQYVNMPPIINVPVVIPYAQGAGLLLTLPIRAGDECMLVFADRAIDNVAEFGGVQPPPIVPVEGTTTPRAHHLTDGICIPGFIARPKAVPDYNTENIELRDRDRKTYISLGPSGITITDGTATWTMSDGVVTIDAPGGLIETSNGPISRSTPATYTVTCSNVRIGGEGGGNTFSGPLHATEDITTDADLANGGGTRLGTHTHGGILPGGADTQPPNTGS